jgi:hypothetical protein
MRHLGFQARAAGLPLRSAGKRTLNENAYHTHSAIAALPPGMEDSSTIKVGFMVNGH